MIILKNEKLEVKIAEFGAEIKSVLKDGVEYLWNSAPEIWGKSAPLMFPICGGLKDNKYIFEGKEYYLPKHGFAQTKMFTVESQDDTSAVFLLKDDEKTRESYPFSFELRVIYTLLEDSIKIGYEVKNLDNKTMYFNLGSHEAYYTPEGIEDYDIIFPEKETLTASYLYGSQLAYNGYTVLKDSNVLPLYEKYFAIDALVFTEIKSRSATLRNRKTGRSVTVDFPDASYFLLWHKSGAPYMCLEPWGGIPDYHDSNYDITTKPGITMLGSGKTYNCSHTIKF